LTASQKWTEKVQFKPVESSLGIEEGRESDRAVVEMNMVKRSILHGYPG